MPDFIIEHEFDTASAFLSALSPWSSSTDLLGYIFRGHSDDAYELIPTSIRHAMKDEVWKVCGMSKPINDQSEWEDWQSRAEYLILREFYKIADRRGLYVPHAEGVRARLASLVDFGSTIRISHADWLPNDLFELAGLAQHYGLPTRLLDWSYDPLISAYFAAASAKADSTISVWALDAQTVSFMNETVHKSPLTLITPPYHGNPNLAAQSGLFTTWSVRLQATRDMLLTTPLLVDRTPLTGLMKMHCENHSWKLTRSLFLKFKISSKHAPNIVRLLNASGYGASRLFPGYRGVAIEVAQRHTSQP